MNDPTIELAEFIKKCAGLAVEIEKLVPKGKERQHAKTKLEEVILWVSCGMSRTRNHPGRYKRLWDQDV